MIEMRWVGRTLQYRESGEKWTTVPQRREMPPFVKAAREVVSQYEQHGIGVEFPELQAAIESLQKVFEGSMWSRL